MTVLDLVVLGLVLLFLLHGFVKGLLRKLAGIAALIGASIGVGFVAAAAAAYAQERWNTTAVWLHPVCAVLGWIVLYLVLRIVLGLLAKLLLAAMGEGVKSWDRKLGALFGAIEALVLCWFIVTLLDAYPEDLRAQQLPQLHEEMQRSLFGRLVHETNPAVRLELQPLIADLATVARKPAALRSLAHEPDVAKFLQHPKVRAIVADPQLAQEFAQGDRGRFFDDPKVRDALQDPEVRDMLRQLPIRDLLRKAAEEAREEK
jgi:membrane protein required for colicin V production